MKQCCSCKNLKTLDNFGSYKKSKDGLQSRCKPCKQKYDNKYYRKNLTRQASIKKSNSIRLQKRLEYISEYLKSNPCIDCGETDILYLEFDHVSGSKVASVMKIVRQLGPWQQLVDEMNKCEVRCVKCHRKVTYERLGSCWRVLI